jgi:hypothetical protein
MNIITFYPTEIVTPVVSAVNITITMINAAKMKDNLRFFSSNSLSALYPMNPIITQINPAFTPIRAIFPNIASWKRIQSALA